MIRKIGTVQVRAQVRVLLEIDVPDSWSPNVTAEQVTSQAKDSAEKILQRCLDRGDARGIRIARFDTTSVVLTETPE